MRQFTAEYLQATRVGMWADSREALAPLALSSRDRVLDVGAGTGAFTAVLREESSCEVVALDADTALLQEIPAPRTAGDALRLPFRDDTFDLVVCQALLVNLPDPDVVLREFARVSRDVVAVVEPDNSGVTIQSTVETEQTLARRARAMYLDGVGTDAEMGAIGDRFEDAGLRDVTVTQYPHTRKIDPPYSERAVESARRKASGQGLDSDRTEILAGDVTPEEYDDLRQDWREMGRTVIDQMQTGEYRHTETVPFYVTVGHVQS